MVQTHRKKMEKRQSLRSSFEGYELLSEEDSKVSVNISGVRLFSITITFHSSSGAQNAAQAVSTEIPQCRRKIGAYTCHESRPNRFLNRQDPKSRTPESGLEYCHAVDCRTLRWIYCLDPPRGLGPASA